MKVVMKNTASFRALLRKMSKNLPEAAVKFAKDKVIIFGMDSKSILAGKLIISKKYLRYYGYKPISNIAVNLNNLCTLFERLKGDVTLALEGDRLILSASNKGVRKEFGMEIMRLGSWPGFPKWKPIVFWNTDGRVEGIKKISMHVNKGPLVIDLEQDGYKLSWLIAPFLVNEK